MADAVISAAQVKALREATGMGMMECKKALVECDGDFEKAQDWLRVKSGAKADKVSARQASEGRVVSSLAKSRGTDTHALVKISCETDFVARDKNIDEFADAFAVALALSDDPHAVVADAERPSRIPMGDGDVAEVPGYDALQLRDGRSVGEARKTLVMKLGENIDIRARVLSARTGVISHYEHIGNKVAAMCRIERLDGEPVGPDAEFLKLFDIGRDVCMHIAAMQPRYLDEAAVPAEVMAREREVFAAQVAEEGKPAEMAEKIVDGKLKKRMAELTLMQQPFVKDADVTVAQFLERAGVTIRDHKNGDLVDRGFVLLVVGAAD